MGNPPARDQCRRRSRLARTFRTRLGASCRPIRPRVSAIRNFIRHRTWNKVPSPRRLPIYRMSIRQANRDKLCLRSMLGIPMFDLSFIDMSVNGCESLICGFNQRVRHRLLEEQYYEGRMMNWDISIGQCKRMYGRLLQQLGGRFGSRKLVLNGERSEYAGRLQMRYGTLKHQALWNLTPSPMRGESADQRSCEVSKSLSR